MSSSPQALAAQPASVPFVLSNSSILSPLLSSLSPHALPATSPPPPLPLSPPLPPPLPPSLLSFFGWIQRDSTRKWWLPLWAFEWGRERGRGRRGWWGPGSTRPGWSPEHWRSCKWMKEKWKEEGRRREGRGRGERRWRVQGEEGRGRWEIGEVVGVWNNEEGE